MYGIRKSQNAYFKTSLLVEKEAEEYKIRSISRSQRPGLYFATLVPARAKNLPDIIVKVEYKTLAGSSRSFYTVFTIKEANNVVMPVCTEAENILGKKVTSIIDKFNDVDFDKVKEAEDKQNVNAAGK